MWLGIVASLRFLKETHWIRKRLNTTNLIKYTTSVSPRLRIDSKIHRKSHPTKFLSAVIAPSDPDLQLIGLSSEPRPAFPQSKATTITPRISAGDELHLLTTSISSIMSNPLDTDAGSELFSSYEAELKLVQADLNQKLDQIPDMAGEPRKAAIGQAERALEEANELVGLADMFCAEK